MTASSAFLSEKRAWVFPVLTLDVVRPFYGMMGLEPLDPALLQIALRDASLVTRKRLSNALITGGRSPTLEDFYDSLAAALGPSGIARFEWWLQKVMNADVRDNLGLSWWTHTLRTAHREREDWERLAFPKEISNQALERFRQAIDASDFKRTLAEVEARPLSDWDLHMYASNLFDFDEDIEGPGQRPLSFARFTADDYRRYSFWAWVLEALSPEQLDQLWQSGVQFVKDEELSSIKALPHPSTLDIGL